MIDPYVDENGVLKNKLNITNDEELNRAEADIGFIQLISIDSVEIDNCPPKEIFKRLHKHIFKDIFDWAGEYRTCPLIKEEFIFPGYTVPYSSSRCIPKDLQSHIFNLELIDWSSMSLATNQPNISIWEPLWKHSRFSSTSKMLNKNYQNKKLLMSLLTIMERLHLKSPDHLVKVISH